MKKIALALLIMVSSLLAELKWVNYDSALDRAKESKKIVMVMLGREDCPACEYMKDIVFKDTKVQTEIDANFIPVYLDIHNDFLPSGLTYIGTPTFHFMNGYEIKKGRIDGGVNVADFMQEIEKVKAKK
ncbi:MAG: thioredoxin family protein [Helicobacteraceae bacterium]|nr:thioredoxin family protein [Helicobacteraceae bacterium]